MSPFPDFRTVARINGDALAENFRLLRARAIAARKGARLMAVEGEITDAESLKKLEKRGLSASEAMPSALEKADGWYRWQIVLRAPAASAIVRAWRWIASARPAPKGVRAHLDMDAVNLM